MKKKIFSIVVIAILVADLFVLTGCGNKQEENSANTAVNTVEEKSTNEEIYLDVLANKRDFIDESEATTKFEDFSSTETVGKLTQIEYAVLDMDQDGQDEMVVLLQGDDGTYLILNYEEEEDTVYGFEVVYRGLKDLKTNGYYMASGGAGLNALCKSTFNKNVREEIILAEESVDLNSGTYVVEDKEVTQSEYENYIETEYEELDDVEWKEYAIAQETTEDNSTADYSENGIYTYVYPQVGTEVDGEKKTITLENGKITYKMDYFENEKTGTYTIENNTIVANYTEESLWNQGEDKLDTETISEEVEYILDKENNKILDATEGIEYTKE